MSLQATNRRRWPHQHRLYICCFCFILAIYIIISNFKASFFSLYPQGTGNYNAAPYPQCGRNRPPSLLKLPAGEKYMFYAPHSGFSNQVGELRNALRIAALLNRTLILPPIFDHHAVALGSCPKFRVREPHEMRASAWAHISHLIRTGQYLAIADIIDLSSVVSSKLVNMIDLRIFTSLWCGVDVSSACSGFLCGKAVTVSVTWGTLESCGALLSGPHQVNEGCVFLVEDDCRTTIWVHGLGTAHQTQEALQVVSGKKSRKHYEKRFKDIVEALGPGSEADRYEVLSFGSLFSSEYKGLQLHVDLKSSSNSISKGLEKAVKFFPFNPIIRNAGQFYAREKIRHPFFCAQLRLLDGQFKNHWEKTFGGLRSQIGKFQNLSGVLHLFVMTDVPSSNWTGTYLGELAAKKSLYKLYYIEDEEPLILETAEKLLKEDYGLQSGFLPEASWEYRSGKLQNPSFVPDILLYVQEVICSCATLGFVGTSGSTISDNILHLRNSNVCNSA